MKLFSGSIETEKCGKTENKNKEAILPLQYTSFLSGIVNAVT